jgi:8-oxo-dGTP pyrophosphatase MutT (NUDIX family)
VHRLVNRLHRSRRLLWFFTKPSTQGVHAIPITPEGEVVLVTLSYARGWRLPGGGLKPGEDPEKAILRELREEIGMTAHAAVEKVTTFTHRPDFRRATSSLFVVRDVAYRPRWSLEIEAVGAFALDALPPDLPPITRRLLAAGRELLSQKRN